MVWYGAGGEITNKRLALGTRGSNPGQYCLGVKECGLVRAGPWISFGGWTNEMLRALNSTPRCPIAEASRFAPSSHFGKVHYLPKLSTYLYVTTLGTLHRLH